MTRIKSSGFLFLVKSNKVMKIIDALKNENIRLSAGDKWLYWDNGLWIVRTKKRYSRNSIILIETENEEKAVNVLLNDE